MTLRIPRLSLVLLIGPSGAGKSTFARTHFKSSQVLSSDFCRYLVSDSENDQASTEDAFDVLRTILRMRLARGRLTVVDATSVQPHARERLLAIARESAVPAVAIVFDLPEATCVARNRLRTDRDIRNDAISTQIRELRASLPQLKQEGFALIYTLTAEDMKSALIDLQSAVGQAI